MAFTRLRRLAAGVVGALLAAALAPAAAPAASGLQIDFDDLILVAPTSQTRWIGVSGDQPGALHDVTITVDSSEAAGVAVIRPLFDWNTPCKATSKTLLTCTYESLARAGSGWLAEDLWIRPVEGAKLGAAGSVTIKLTSREGAAGRTSAIEIGEAVALEAGPSTGGRAKPGDIIRTPLSVKNASETAVNGVELFFYIDPWYTPAKKFSNCWYAVSAGYCHFDTVLDAGATYAASEAAPARVRPDYPAPGIVSPSYTWHTVADNRKNVALVKARKATKGTAGALRLTKQAAARKTAHPQTDSSPYDTQYSITEVTGIQTADVAAAGASVRGATGATVKAAVGVKNNGPAFAKGFPEAAAVATVKPPRGVTVVDVPAGCAAKGATYVCTTDVLTIDPGTSVLWTFGLRIDQGGPLTGTVSSTSVTADANQGNNTAQLLINPPGGVPADAAGGSGGAGGGALPITGAPAALLAVGGAVLLIGGAVAFTIARRRRARFVA
ncbi:hypothetical protein AB0M54_19235 [Actinoplanes sp. NPDC051470]|uniref:hypothetical protein n=1 Tax=Actinoplanes sp. NPDC051470 TaxID=3157224 RepID=UPI003444389A